MTSDVRAEARNSISRLAPSMSREPPTTAPENTWTNWISGGRLPAKSTPAACKISLTGMTARSAPPLATISVACVPRGVALTLIFSTMPSRGKRSVLSQIPLVLSGTATVFALSRSSLIASTVLTSGFVVPARTATPRGTRARSTSVPAIIRFAAISSPRPSLERITTSAETPRASCAAIVCGPTPWEAPDVVVTLMPLVRSNSGNSCSYALLNPPDIRTFTAPLHILVNLAFLLPIYIRRGGRLGFTTLLALSAPVTGSPLGIKQSNLHKDAGLIPVNMLVENLAVFEADNDGYGHLNWFSCWGDARQ